MDPDTKVEFTLSIGYPTAMHREVFTLRDLGFDPNYDPLEKFLDEAYHEWYMGYFDGGWSICHT